MYVEVAHGGGVRRVSVCVWFIIVNTTGLFIYYRVFQ